jgi:hypothetical protein
MANVKNLKDINYVLGDIIEAVYLFRILQQENQQLDLIDEAIAAFDALITK